MTLAAHHPSNAAATKDAFAIFVCLLVLVTATVQVLRSAMMVSADSGASLTLTVEWMVTFVLALCAFKTALIVSFMCKLKTSVTAVHFRTKFSLVLLFL